MSCHYLIILLKDFFKYLFLISHNFGNFKANLKFSSFIFPPLDNKSRWNFIHVETILTNLAAIGHAMIVSDLMKKPIITVRSTDDLAKAAQLIPDKKISELPVTNSTDSSNLAGIITKTKLLKH